MAGNIRGITIKLDGDAKGLLNSLQDVNSKLKSTQSTLKDVDKLLKFNPGNTDLLVQKQKNLKEAIQGTKDKVEELKKIQSQYAEGSDEWDAVQREIIDTENRLQSLEKEYRNFGSVGLQQIAAVGQQMQEIGGKIEGVGQKLMPLSTAAAGIAASLAGLAYNALTSADDLNTLSKQTGISTDELQKMQYAADLVDVSVSDITGALKKMKAKMDPTNATFKKLGISVTNADGSLRSATDVFYESLEALSQIENETERDQVAMELFGKSADDLAGIIDDGGAALKEYGQQAEDLGLILDEDTLTSLNNMNDTVDQLKARFGGAFAKLGATLAEVFAPALATVAEKAQLLADKIANLTPEQAEFIVKTLGIVAAVAPLLIGIGKLVTGIGNLATKLPEAIGAVKGFAAALASPIGITALVIAAVVALGVIIYKHWDEIVAWTKDMVEKVKAAWTKLRTNIATTITGIKTSITNTWNNIKTTVATIVTNIVQSITTKFNAAKATVTGVFTSIKSTITNAINGAKTAVSNAIEAIKNLFNLSGISFTWPHIPLPHFTVTPAGWNPLDLIKGIIPSLSIDWYRRAYDNPMMFTSPTVLQTPQGLKGFGDGHGAEIVLGLNKLRELVGTTGNVTVNVYPPAGANVEQIAAAVEQKLVAAQQRRNRAYA